MLAGRWRSPWSRRCASVIGLSLGLVLSRAAWADPPLAQLSAGLLRIEAEVASDPGGRALGLMNRRELAANHGMIFVFAENGLHCMWMRNTLIPLSVAFLDEQGNITNIEEMLPRTENTHCASRPARFALEMSAGWFAAHKIAPGKQISGTARLPEGK